GAGEPHARFGGRGEDYASRPCHTWGLFYGTIGRLEMFGLCLRVGRTSIFAASGNSKITDHPLGGWSVILILSVFTCHCPVV
ncbi:MAG: hypothetical protein CSA23_00535, partial [Deltaproteobacteria bacterium]